MPTPLQVLNWDVTGYQKVAENASHIADTCIAASNDMHGTIYDLAWKGEARYAAESRADREQTQMRAIAIAYDNLSSACAGAVRDMTGPIDDIKTIFRNYVRPPITVGDDWSIDGVEDWNSEAGIQLSRLSGLVEALVTYDAHWGALISQANRELEATAPAPVLAAAYAEIVSAQSTDPRADPERIRTSAAAFQQVFGRAPDSPADWATAEVLNPNSYSPKYNGVSPEIVVGRINPVPGQGLVRSAFYIPAAQVTNLPEYDLGDNRQEDPYFDPEHARVVTYVDYENGIIVSRQNPSVTVDGDVKVDRPEVEAQQLKDGSILVRYDAVNPFAPPGSSLSGHSVNGEIVFAPESGNPGTARIAAGGLITDYPSVEIYQDNSAGTARPVLIDAADSGSQWGPLFNLPFHHEVGGGTAMFDPFRADFSQPDWQRNAPTQLGSVHNPPSVVVVTK